MAELARHAFLHELVLSTLLGLAVYVVCALLILAAFFAGSETALMSLNRYRLRHQANAGNRGARLAEALLAHPDRLIGLILLLSTIVNVVTPTLVGLIAFRLGGNFLVVVGVVALTFVTLIFCEVAPKTFGALHQLKAKLRPKGLLGRTGDLQDAGASPGHSA